MSPLTRRLCRAALILDRIPRYGRLYTYGGSPSPTVRWRYQKRGRWGMWLLNRLGLLWPYIETVERQEAE